MPLRNVVIIAVMVAISLVCYRTAARNRYANLFAEAMDVVDAKSLKIVPRDQLFDSAMDGMFGELDKYSRYIAGNTFREFDEAISQKFGGMGIYVDRHEQENVLVILAVAPDTPASESGLKSGDRILEIDGQSTKDLARRKGIELLKGDIGEAATLRINRNDKLLELDVVRRSIAVDSVVGDFRKEDGSWIFRLEDDPRIGYLKLQQFGERTSAEVADAITQIRGDIDSLIIDLRHNSGGLLPSAISICDMFLPEGKPIVSTLGRNRVRQSEHASTENMLLPESVPIVILVNRYSASASEIVAGCLQDHDRAILIGEQSWGKGTVQNIIPVRPNRSAMKLTTASYWRPSGIPIDRYDAALQESGVWGVRPVGEHLIDLDENDVWRNLQKRNLREIETLIPPETQDDLMPILLGRPLIAVEPRGPNADPDEPIVPMEDVDSDAATLLDWEDRVMDRAIEFLSKYSRSNAA